MKLKEEEQQKKSRHMNINEDRALSMSITTICNLKLLLFKRLATTSTIICIFISNAIVSN